MTVSNAKLIIPWRGTDLGTAALSPKVARPPGSLPEDKLHTWG